FALEDAIDVFGRAPVRIDQIVTVRDQAAGGGEETIGGDCRQLVPRSELYDHITGPDRPYTSRHDQSAVRGTCEFRDSSLDLPDIAHVDWAHLHSQQRPNRLNGAELSTPRSDTGIAQDRCTRHVGRNLLEQFNQFPAHAV